MKRDAAKDAATTRSRMSQDDSRQQALFAGGTVDQAARALAKDLIDWDEQFGGPEDAECIVAGEDFARWIALARQVVAK